MKAILSADLNWAIGYEGNLLMRVPDDMKFFKRKTLGKVVLMGRKTYESLPGKAPLEGRVNIVLSRDENFSDDRVTVCHTIDEALNEIKKYDKDDVFIIGGEKIYKEFLPYCEKVYVTKFKKKFEADTFFPNLDADENWESYKTSTEKEYKGMKYCFTKYKNLNLGSEKSD